MRAAHAMFVLAAALALLPVSRAQADVLWFHTQLQGANEKMPNSVPASGYATAELDTVTRTVRYRVVFSGLSSGGVASLHYHGAMLPDIMFHGPKLPGMRAPELIFMIDHPTSPVTGVRRVNDRQLAELKAGEWYVNIHTAKYPAGEIRGWLEPGRRSK
jgi:hypothetical protein